VGGGEHLCAGGPLFLIDGRGAASGLLAAGTTAPR
jgi:hypothetical protein